MHRIGGDMEIDISLLLSTKKREIADLTKKYNYFRWTDTGRSAIYLAIEDILKKGGKKVVYMPAFVCDAVKQPFLEQDFQLHFYSMGQNLNSPSLLPETLNKEVFLFINYFGHENESLMQWVNDKKKKNSFFVIEDRAQAAFSDFNKVVSDYIVYSYRKFTPQPDGGLLISKYALDIKGPSEISNNKFLNDQITGKIIRALTADEKHFLELLKTSENELDNKVEPYTISDFSLFLMERLNFYEIVQKRRENWRLVQNMIKKDAILSKFVTPVFKNLKSNEVPLGYPIIVRKDLRNQLRFFLIQRNIFCPIHWNISNDKIPEDYNLSLSILTLPIDQRMSEEHIHYLVNAIYQFFIEVEK